MKILGLVLIGALSCLFDSGQREKLLVTRGMTSPSTLLERDWIQSAQLGGKLDFRCESAQPGGLADLD